MKQILNKYWLFVLSFLFFASFYFYYETVFNSSVSKHLVDFQAEFNKKEKKLGAFLAKKKELLLDKGVDHLCQNNADKEFYFHVYRNDSLVFWNSNHLPIIRFTDIHFPANGILKLQNAWYYSKNFKHGNITFVGTFLLKNQFTIENEYLVSDFSSSFKLPFDADISLEKDNTFSVFDQDKQFAFGLSPVNKELATDYESNLLIFLFVLALSVFLLALYLELKTFSKSIQLSIAFGTILLHYLAIRYNFYSFLENTRFFDHSIYASSNWFPNLFILILNCIFLLFFISILCFRITKITDKFSSKIWTNFFLVISFVYAYFIAYLYQSIVIDSTIPLEIEKLFKLDFYSFWATLSMGIIFYSYFIFVHAICVAFKKSNWKTTSVVVIWFLSGVIYFIFEISYVTEILFSACWPLIINGLILYKVYRTKGKFSFNFGVILLFLFAAYISININEFLSNKERQERELFAQQLASDQDISTEIEYEKLSSQLISDKIFQKILLDSTRLSDLDIKNHMERKYFNEFWDRYEFDFYLVQNNGNESSKEFCENLILNHSTVSEVNANFYFIKDFTSQLSYIGKHQIYNPDSTRFLTLYLTLKSKRIPEKIGFPRLLISNKANVFKAIENYSIAKYYKGKLISQSGKFSFPIEDLALTNNEKDKTGYFNSEDYNHFLLRKSKNDLIVLSKKIPTNFQLFTSFSYLFCFFGFFLLLPVSLKNIKTLQFSNITLAFKIQMVLVSIVVVSLLFFSFGSGTFVSDQYNEYSNDLIREKINSVCIELKNKIGKAKSISIEKNGEFIQQQLQKFANVFVTDINLYDKNGYLLGSSRPKIYNLGLLSEQINPDALDNMKYHRKSEFIHQESIGSLNFLSAYIPLSNEDGNFLAYINLQHFGQQQGFENQIEKFLVAIINVFVLLLAFSIILSIIVSNWVTAPLKIIQQSFAKVQIGKYNEPILYESNDEIGALIRNYNLKLEELAFTAQQLAQSERESAWREMAKQVAHEIKNPLTPMKLSLQHLQRIYDPNDEKSQILLGKVIASVIEQIDGLTKIANEFSNFAKMPVENKEKIDLLPIIENILLVFSQENNCDIKLESVLKEIVVLADKDLMIRIFNNLLKNAIQAIPMARKGEIDIKITKKNAVFLFAISDNGNGISDDLIHKVFTPNFTTKSTGTGLGLAMVKQIVELHEGKIWFEANDFQGTSFYFTLPRIN